MAYVRCGTCAHGDWLRPGARYCAACGGALSEPCAGCGEPLLAGDRFCVFCARPVAAPAGQAAAPAGQAAAPAGQAAAPAGHAAAVAHAPAQAPAGSVEMPVEEVRLLQALAAGAVERSLEAAARPPVPTKAHLDQGDIDALFS